MAVDPRTFLVVPCLGSAGAGAGKQQMVRRAEEGNDYLTTIPGQVGDLEFLNDIGFGRVAEGLRVLTQTSNSIRLGQSQNSAVRAAQQGYSDGGLYVLDQAGVPQASLASVNRFQPGAVNQAYGQAQQIWEKVKQGNFELSDIPEYFQDVQNLFQLASGIYTESGGTSRARTLCDASPYAVDLVAFAPKFPFLFVVEFVFTDEYQQWALTQDAANDFAKNTAFVVQTASRPEVKFNHETVNMYNYRTHVPTRTEFAPMKMTFFDDNKDNALRMYTAILRAMSPITNNENIFEQTQEQIENDSMAFNNATKNTYSTTNQGVETRLYNASIGPLAGMNTFSLFKEIKIYHLADYGQVVDVYRFLRPKVTTIKMSDLDMQNSQPSMFEFEFAYDALYVEPRNKHIIDSKEITTKTEGGLYPIRPVLGTDPGVNGPYGENMPSVRINPLIDLSFIGNFIKQATGIVGGIIKSITSVIGEFIGGLLSAGRTFLSNAFTGVSNFVGSIFTPVKNAASALFGDAVGTVRAGANYVLGGASNMLSGFSNSFSRASVYTGSRFVNPDLAGSASASIFDPPLTQQQQMLREQEDDFFR